MDSMADDIGYNAVVQRLVRHGIPLKQLDQMQAGLVTLVQENKSLLPEVVLAILPTDADVAEAQMVPRSDSGSASRSASTEHLFTESMLWLQWLMFENEPESSLKSLAEKAVDQWAVCGAVWGKNDLAYRCRTCEHDPTCAICVSCFQNGNHKDHDYSIIYTGGGCCDCGDDTAWKCEGFCSKHKGKEQIQPLSKEAADSIGPVLDTLFLCWKDKLLAVKGDHKSHPSEDDPTDLQKIVANELSSAIVHMLLDFCNCSESLLSFISRRISESAGMLHWLVRGEMFLDDSVVKKLHELLLKLLGDPLFKYDFAKIYIDYYPHIVQEAVKKCSDSTDDSHPMLSTFSVQIFTVPTLTARLVREVDLVGVFLKCLGDIFYSCVGEDGYLLASKWSNLNGITIQLIEDTRFSLSHNEVPSYIAHESPDVFRSWVKLLGNVQGMDPQKRITGLLHIEEENDRLHFPFMLGHFLGKVHIPLAEGAFCKNEVEDMKNSSPGYSGPEGFDDGERPRHAKVGRVSEESSACCLSRGKDILGFESHSTDANFCIGIVSIPSKVTWLISECLKAIEIWLEADTAQRQTGCNFLSLRKRLFRTRNGKNSTGIYRKSFFLADSKGTRRTTISKCNKGIGTSQGTNAVVNSERRETPENNGHPGKACSFGASNDHTFDANLGAESEALGLLSLAEWPEIIYDVSSQEVSFHIPLHRFLSLLLRKALRTCYGETGMNETSSSIATVPLASYDFFQQVLRSFHPYGFSAFLMEHPLRLRVFCAQVHAGMWRKNGDAGLFISEWYHGVLWFEIGVEVDLFLLQCCAAQAPPELFVTRIVERFGLLNYLSLNLAEYNEYEAVLVQEMLTLIIHIVKERRFCGLSLTESLQRDIIYKLATGDVTHSQLVKALPYDLSKSDQLQKVVDTLAVYVNPSGMKQGKYSLRTSYWKELDLYHPRWNSRDLQIAEERYFRFCKISPLDVQLPRWTKIFGPLSMISRIATSKMVLRVVRAVLFYAVFAEMPSVCRAPDGVLVTALHLLSLALDICEKQKVVHINKVGDGDSCPAEDAFPVLIFATGSNCSEINKELAIWKHQSLLSLLVSLMRKQKKESNQADSRLCNISSLIEGLLKKFAQLNVDCMNELKQLAPDVVFQMPQHSCDSGNQKLDLAPDADERKAKARERQAVILEKMRAQQSKFIASFRSIEKDLDMSKVKQEQVQEESTPVCSLCHDTSSKSPLSLLVLLQKSRLSSFVDRGPPSWEETSTSAKDLPAGVSSSSEVVQPSQLEIAYDSQQTGVGVLLDFAADWLPNIRNIQLPNPSYHMEKNTLVPLAKIENDIYQSIQEDICHVKFHSDALVGDWKCWSSLASAASRTSQNTKHVAGRDRVASLLSKTSKHSMAFMESLQHLVDASPISNIPPIVDCDGIHISSCGHAVHQECHERYLSSLRQRYLRGLGFEGGHIVNPDMGELLCPVCRRFANSIIPVLSDDSGNAWKHIVFPDSSSTSNSGSPPLFALDDNIFRLPHALSLLQSAAKTVKQDKYRPCNLLKIISGKVNEAMESSLEPILRKLCTMYFPHKHGNFAPHELSHSLILWDILRYSLISTEIAARGREITCSEGSCTKALHGELDSNALILSVLLQIANASRSLSHHHLLLRFRGVQFFMDSIYWGDLAKSKISNAERERDTLSSIFEDADKDGGIYGGIQFLKFAAEPILAHDPFSSLMWTLFSLPLPFMSSAESFLSLVHLFYVVCVVQALITCYGKNSFDGSISNCCLLSDICKTMGESDLAQQYFVSNYFDDSSNLKDTVQKLTFPYLRRCLLLWKLLKSSPSSVPCHVSANVRFELTTGMDKLVSDSTDNLPEDARGVTELETMFHIHSPHMVFNDKTVHTLAFKWCQHFYEVFNGYKPRHVLYSTPAVPFRLMQLPLLYQELLQRYIKQQCPECGNVPEEPALCLLCGKLCSRIWKDCCRQSRCQNHAATCGAGIGVFLLVRSTTILLQRSARLASWPSPYLDAFGEEDPDLSRGRPLYLSEERYSALTNLVTTHGLDRSSEVLSRTTIDHYEFLP